MKVIDASCLIDFLTDASRGRLIAPHLEDDLFAPDILVAEMHQCLRSFERSGVASDAELQQCRSQFADAAIDYLPVWPYERQIWEWRHSVSTYDAMYVALAADLGCPLLTSDRRLASAVSGIVPVICV